MADKAVIYSNEDFTDWRLVRCYDEDHAGALLAAKAFGHKLRPLAHATRAHDEERAFDVPIVKGKVVRMVQIQTVAPNGTLYYRNDDPRALALIAKAREHFGDFMAKAAELRA